MLSRKTIRKIGRKFRAQEPTASDALVALWVRYESARQSQRRAVEGMLARQGAVHDAWHASIGQPMHNCGGECRW